MMTKVEEEGSFGNWDHDVISGQNNYVGYYQI